MTNFRMNPVTLKKVEVFAGTKGDTLLRSYEGSDLADSLERVGSPADGSDSRTIGGGQRVVLFVWLPIEKGVVPSMLRHRISFDLNTQEGNIDNIAEPVSRGAPVVLSPPLRGGPWVAVYDPDLKAGHRRVIFAIDGKARIPARFAIDWIKLGPDGRSARGNASVPSNAYGYGEDVLAVADGVIADVKDGFPEPTPNISLSNEAGNYVCLDLGSERFAFYEHLKPGSIRVKTGERVRAGQVLGSLGASGSVFSGAHLHFHVADANSLHGAEGLPFALNGYYVLGAYTSLDALSQPWVAATGQMPREQVKNLPAMLTVVRFD